MSETEHVQQIAAAAVGGEGDSLALGRFLVDLGVALLQGRIRLSGEFPALPALSVLAHDHSGNGVPPRFQGGERAVDAPGSHINQDGRYVPPVVHGRPNARARFSPRKGYALAAVKGKKSPDLTGITPAGTRLMDYLARNAGATAMQIADDLGLSKKTVENVLSILRQRSLVEASDLK